jgi:hypothetical protein
VRQLDIAVAFGSNVNGTWIPLSLTAVSGWERGVEIPTVDRLQNYARFFATARSIPNEGDPRLLPDDELSEQEQTDLKQLADELLVLREQSVRALTSPPESTAPVAVEEVLRASKAPVATRPTLPEGQRFWHFPDGQPIFIVGSKVLDPNILAHPYMNSRHPNRMPMALFADGLAIVELFGHLRAENPLSDVRFKTHDEVDADDLSGHVVVIGGGDVNPFAEWFSDRMDVPIASAAGPGDRHTTPTEDAAFTVYGRDGVPGTGTRHGPIIKGHIDVTLRQQNTDAVTEEWPNLVYDVALLARQENPLNTTATATLCHGLYGSGTYGAVRTFTDARLREANERYRQERFGDSEEFYMLIRVLCNQKLGVITTPDLNRRYTRILEWPE